MRVTNSMLVNNLMRNLNINLTKMDFLQNQLATGRKFASISDDPISLIYSQTARNKLARLSHYQTTIGSGQDWLSQAELGIMELQGTIQNAYEATVDAATSVKTQSDRQNLARVMAQFRDHFVDTLNTAFGDKYIFGGYNTPGEPAAGLKDTGTKAFTVQDYLVTDAAGNQVLDALGNPLMKAGLFYNGCNLSQFDGWTVAEYKALFQDVSFNFTGVNDDDAKQEILDALGVPAVDGGGNALDLAAREALFNDTYMGMSPIICTSRSFAYLRRALHCLSN